MRAWNLTVHNSNSFVSHLAWCPVHEKKAFTRKAARAAIRQMHESGLREYRCTYLTDLWHVGHLAPEVRQGRITADVYYTLSR